MEAAKIPDNEIDKWVTIKGKKVPIGKDGEIHPGYDQGKLGEGGDGGFSPKKNVNEYQDVKTFVKDNLKELKEMGVKDFEKSMDIFVGLKMGNQKPKDIGRQKSIDTINSNIKDSIMNGWFRKEDKGFKPKLVENIMMDSNNLNAGWNIMHENFKNRFDSDISFKDFMNKELTLYRGGKKTLDEAFTSYSMDRKIAEKFGKDINTISIKPIDTLGSYQTTGETEVLIPKQRYDKMKEKKGKAK